MKIAILGFGTVGEGVYKILTESKDLYQSRFGQSIEIEKILVHNVAKKRDIKEANQIITDNFEEILQDPNIELIVEVTSSKNQAIEYIRKSLMAGKHVVSANKAAIAVDFKELQKIAIQQNVHFKFEASVAGGIPVLSSLGRLIAFNDISLLHGIINSSTNYVLTEICKGRDETEVIAEARELGILEANPTDDIAGFDARRKLAILAMMILQIEISEQSIPSFGITQVDSRDSEILNKLGYEIKLIAELLNGEKSGLKENQIALSVFPTALNNSKFNRVNGMMNEVTFNGSYCGELRFYGAGGSMYPTANAIVSDIYETITNKPLYFPVKENQYENISDQIESSFYIRIPDSLMVNEDLNNEIIEMAEKILLAKKEVIIFSKPISNQKAVELFERGLHVIRLNQKIK